MHTGNARVWFDDLPQESIDSYDDLKKAFLENYLQQKKCIKDSVKIDNIKQRDGESPEEFVRRYKLECRDVKGSSKCMKISGFMNGTTNPELIKRLHDKILKSVDEMMRVTTTFLKGEVPTSNREWKKSSPSWRQQEARHKQNIKKGGFWNQQRSERKHDRNASKICEFHKEEGHTTDDCMHLKRQIKEMLKAGNLSHLFKELKQSNGKDQAKIAKKGETSGKNKLLAILMVQPWQRVAKQRITQTFSSELVTSFLTLGEEDGTEGPMIIEAEMGGHFVHRMYVDGGSSSKILYEHCFNRFRPKVRNQMIHATTPLVGFSGEIICPLGQILLLVKIGDEEHSTYAWVNFMVVRSPSLYNRIKGRLGSNMIIPLECIMVSGPGVPQPIINQVTEEKIQVAIHLEYLEQTIAIGSTLIEDGRKELCGLLRRNLDIFSWRPADMAGVPRYIAVHRQNIREGCLPVRQKKRGQAPERNKAMYEEVKKLGDAGIMKEVHYHSWLSNPVMVKKHDDSWRMCVDFKDLNKVCPKDGYPLPKIDWKMSFGLKNAGATYQRLVDKDFQKQIGQKLEVYVDDLVIKSRMEQEVIKDIEETFKTLREINMKLNPKKCAFGMREGTFLGYQVNTDGLRVCPDKVEAVLNLPSPKCLKDVQKLNEKLASLNRFLSKSAEKSLPFFKALKKCTKKSDFQ
ncbi:reverse transcriptase domain-containing protein [Tanacetum coccineum]